MSSLWRGSASVALSAVLSLAVTVTDDDVPNEWHSGATSSVVLLKKTSLSF